MKNALIHVVCYTLVAATSFWGGALTRDYLVNKERMESRQRPSRYLGKPAPELQSNNLQADPWSLADQRGKVVVLEFWATWCGPCVAALPQLKAIDKEFSVRPDFALLGISLDAKTETVRAFCAKNSLTWPQLFEPSKEWGNSIAKAFEVKAVPFVCVIDKKGIVRYYNGAILKDEAMDIRSLIQKLLSE